MTPTFRYWLVTLLLTLALVGLHLVSHEEAVPLSEPLASFPVVLGKWHGRDLQMEPRILNGLAVDDHLYRLYEDGTGDELSVYIGYYKSQRAGELIHSPKNCLPGAGWQPVRADYTELVQPNGQRVAVNVYEVQKGLDRRIVLYWYQSHGRVVASEYSAKAYMVLDALQLNRTDAALVRIVAPIQQDQRKTREWGIAFAQQMLGRLATLLP